MGYRIDKVLLVGNGFNLVSDKGAGWNELLNRVAGEASTEHEEKVRKEKPFTLWFEELIRHSSATDIKQEISKYLKECLEPNNHHVDLMNLGFTNILTTNYDYNLENSVGQKWEKNHPAKEDYYSLFRRNSIGQQNVWHIHGELNTSKSIMLGHEQYSGYMQKIGSFLTSGVATEVKAREGRPYLSSFSGKKSKTKGDVPTWVDLFLEKEVHIIGFSFDYTENHLWNLLMQKEKLSRKYLSIGEIFYHRCSDHKQTTADEAKLSILTSLGANIKDHVGSSYEKAYQVY
jgi:hypothetical protein